MARSLQTASVIAPATGARLLVVDDDPDVRDSLRRSLAFEGYEVTVAANGEEALSMMGTTRPHAVILDLQMPRMDGLDVCRRLRAAGNDTPVLMLTARGGIRDRVTGLDVGADDYVMKPFALEELMARLRALLRRQAPTGPDPQPELLTFDNLVMDLAAREVRRDSRVLALTRTEYELLATFLRNPGRVLTRRQILQEVWGYDFDPGSNTLVVYVGYLRRKIEAHGGTRLLHTVRGVGFVLRPDPPP